MRARIDPVTVLETPDMLPFPVTEIRAEFALKDSRYASLDWRPKPFPHVERGPYNNPNIGSSDFSNHARAAYNHALCFALSREEGHATKVREIINAWSGTLTSISNHDARLLIGMSGYHFCIGAELLKHTWGKWPEEEQFRFETMIRNIWYPVIRDYYPTANGNWDASMLQVMIAMGVFLDDHEMFDRAKNYYLRGRGNGAIGNYFILSGQCQESGRDQAHTQMGLEFLANTCETAWIQGVAPGAIAPFALRAAVNPTGAVSGISFVNPVAITGGAKRVQVDWVLTSTQVDWGLPPP